MITAYDAIGLAGVAVTLYAYARVQWQRDYAKNIWFSLHNLIGAACMLVTLSENWNLSSFTVNVAWSCISLYGVYRCLKYRWQSKREG